ncbi:Osmotin-like protein OSML13 [Linum perenne]
MTYFPNLLISLLLWVSITNAAVIDIFNNCPYTVWAASTPIGGGRRLDHGQTWTINPPVGTSMARIWGRRNCNFDGSGRGWCETGDCGGVLNCQGWGVPPNTLAEYALNQFSNLDFYDISLVDGFNIPMIFTPTSNVGSGNCQSLTCTADINTQCPGFSRFFKDRCPTSYSYPQDDPSSTFTCPAGTNYRVVFCPYGATHIDENNNNKKNVTLAMVTEKISYE